MLNILSGIGPSDKGAGLFVEWLYETLTINKIELRFYSYYSKRNLFTKIVKSLGLIDIARLSYYRLLKIKASKSYSNIRNSKVLIIHPQSLGFEVLFELINNNNKIFLFVVDNSFFCIRSYNFLPGNFSPCLQCLGSNDFQAAKKNSCSPFPVKFNIDENISNLITLKKYFNQITFLVQNSNQKNLIKLHFGNDINAVVLGMYTKEFFEDMSGNDVSNSVSSQDYDFIYHGTLLECKGLRYTIELAGKLGEFRFLIPYTKKDVIKELKIELDEINIDFIPFSWNSGLKKLICSAKIVLCPSLWSAPVESGLIKSIKYNGCVAALKTENSFSSELPGNVIIPLNSNLQSSAILLKEIITKQNIRNNYISASQKWLDEYLEKRENVSKILVETLQE